MKTRDIVLSSTIAALYVVFTISLAPLSFGPIQFRVSEILKVFVLFNPMLAFGIGIGTFFANLLSPYAGPLELIWMPLTDIAGGIMAWAIYRYILRHHLAIIPMAIYSLTTGAAVGLMLFILGVADFWFTTFTVGISEAFILIAGTPLIFWIVKMLSTRGIKLQPDSPSA